MDEQDKTQQQIAGLREEIKTLGAETVALQAMLGTLLNHVMFSYPQSWPLIFEALDSAACAAEKASIERGVGAAHIPAALKVTEQIRALAVGSDKPKPAV